MFNLVDQCKRKWKNLRDAYRAEAKRLERRIEGDKLFGTYSDDNNYKSKWAYFDAMSFIKFTKRRPFGDVCHEGDISNSNSLDRTSNHYDNETDFYEEENFQSAPTIKTEPEHNEMENETHNMDGYINNEDDDEEANDLLFEEFQNIATPQAARRLSSTLSIINTAEHKAHLAQQQTDANTTPSSSKKPYSNCKCSQRTDEQLHFLEDLGREEQKLISSTKQDITRSNNLDHIGDSDYNFLVSFLPQMKKMNELQNLQFRAKMCEIVLNILAPSMTVEMPSMAPSTVNIPAINQNLDNITNATATSTSSNALM